MEPRTFSLRYRPQTFEELFDQEHIKRTLINAISKNRLVHAYLFAGPRGVGKTTTARILAKSLNCENGPTITPCNKCSACNDIKSTRSMDVLEIDGASNRGIDQIRELRENIRYRPTSGRYRIYIIDEVHMLTTEAFNALLKTLEEPPSHVIFIFATTEPHKVPPTILSRCQRFDFKRIAPEIITQRLNMIITAEKLKVEEDAVRLIADIADGGLRDAESILEQITTFAEGRVSTSDVTELLGIVPGERFNRFLELIRTGKEKEIIAFLEDTFSQGYDIAEFYFGIIGFLRTLLFARLGMSTASSAFPDAALSEAQHRTPKQLANFLGKFLKSEEAFKRSREKIVFIETLALSLLDEQNPEWVESTNPSTAPSLRKKPEPPDGDHSAKGSSSRRKKDSEETEPVSQDNPEVNTADAEISSIEENDVSRCEPSSSQEMAIGEEKENQPKNCEKEKSKENCSIENVWSRFLADISTEHSFVSLALKGSQAAVAKNNILKILLRGDAEAQVGLLEHQKEDLEKRIYELTDVRFRLTFEVKAPEEGRDTKSASGKKSGSTLDDVLDVFNGEIVR